MKIFVATHKRTEERFETPYIFELIDTIKALGDSLQDWSYQVKKVEKPLDKSI